MMGKILPKLYFKIFLVFVLIGLAVATLWPRREPVVQPDGTTKLEWKTRIPLGLDLKGGSELLYKIRTAELTPEERKDIVQRTIDVIHRRVDPDGRMELDIRPRGQDRFYIQLPGMGPEEAHRIESLIRKAGQLQFKLVDDKPEDFMAARRGEHLASLTNCTPYLPALDPKTGMVKRDEQGRIVRWHKGTFNDVKKLPPEISDHEWYLVENRAYVTGQYLSEARAEQDPTTGAPTVGFTFRGQGRTDFERLTEQYKTTEEHPGRQLAIILDEDLYSAPTIQSRISGSGVITGKFTKKEVEDLVTTLRAGQLPADIDLEWNNTVGAQLGEDSIRAGVKASIVALICVIGFMAVYYMIGGAVADFAVLVNLLLVLAGMAGMQSVLTLPGIAGLVLTLGMAVDANVLINERIREESERGKTLRLAIRTGYERAFMVILDTHLTTIITALILFGVGTGPVRGFAIALILGLLLSLFTSYWVTRWIVDLFVEKNWLNKLHMLHLFGRPSIPFSKYRYLCIAGTVIFSIAGLTLFLTRWENERDTELSGGFRAEVGLKRALPIGQVRERCSKLFPEGADVQSVGAGEAASGQSESWKIFSIRIRKLTKEQKLAKMAEDFTAMLKARGLYSAVEAAAPADVNAGAWEFKLHLAKPCSDLDLRKMLGDQRYTESDIREIALLDQKAGEFSVRLKAVALATDPETKIAAVLNALEPMIVDDSVHVKIGGVATEDETRAESGPAGATLRPHVTLDLAENRSTEAVRQAIYREILGNRYPEDLRVNVSASEANAETARKMVVYGAVSDLEQIAGSKKTDLRVMSFTVPAGGELRITLRTKQLQSEVQQTLSDRLKEASKLSGLVRSIIPLGAAGQEYLVSMNILSEDKTVEKIKEELITGFAVEIKPEGAEQEGAVALDSAPAPDYYVGDDALKFQFFKLTLGVPAQLQQIHATLVASGYPNALVVKGNISERDVANRLAKEAYIRLQGAPEKVEEARANILDALKRRQNDPFRSIETIGSAVAGETRNKAVLAILMSWVAMIFYLWFRFGEAKFGLATVIALVHDVCFTLGAVGLADALSGTAIGNFLGFSDIKVNLTMIAAFLTLMGYSANDTIVVFDRIRENMGGARRRVDAALVDTSVNQTLSRTVLTSLTVLFVVVVLYIMGGPVIHGFAFVMTVGVCVGTYSSIFIASPILIGWESTMGGLRKLFRIVTFRSV